jgi:superfamily II DNA or RNA helicase
MWTLLRERSAVDTSLWRSGKLRGKTHKLHSTSEKNAAVSGLKFSTDPAYQTASRPYKDALAAFEFLHRRRSPSGALFTFCFPGKAVITATRRVTGADMPNDPAPEPSPNRRARRRVPPSQRHRLFLRSRGVCEREGCSAAIDLDAFQVSHLRAHVHGGALVDENLAAWCIRCNLENGSRDVDDTRLIPRDWQLQALPAIARRIRDDGAATLSAAPGAGKTLFAALVFEHLRELGIVDRMVVLAPRRTLVKQWVYALAATRHLELRPFHELERSSQQDGVVVTYQSLNHDTLFNHRTQAERLRTLLVLDEAHHVGEPAGEGCGRPAWARYVTELAGTVDTDLHVAGVLNLSGTLWRSNRSERISTVRYRDLPDGRLESLVDWEVPVEQLIGAGELRPVDLFRLGAEVRVADWKELAIIDSRVSDLDAKPARAAIAGLPQDRAWRDAFVSAILDRLEQAWRSLDKKVPVKALIVAGRQADARAFQETANRLMRERGLKPIAELAVSDEKDAADTLEMFRRSRRVGVLCTVDMAGEGYDCPEIAVVGFASNKLTPLYVRQVVARAQRVTEYEATKGGPIPAAIVLPDAQELVEVMSQILAPMHHEVAPRPERRSLVDAEHEVAPDDSARLTLPAYVLEGVAVADEVIVRVTGAEDGDVDLALVRLLEEALAQVALRPSDAARVIVAVRSATSELRDERPFEPLRRAEREVEAFGAASRSGNAPATSTSPKPAPMTIEHEAELLERRLARLGAWWHQKGNSPVTHFVAEMNRAGGIPTGGRRMATVKQLEAAWNYGWTQVRGYCEQQGIPEPRSDRWA